MTRHRLWIILLAISIILIAQTGNRVAHGQGISTPEPSATQTEALPAKSTGKLSFRLDALANSAQLAMQSSAAKAMALSLPESGPGSLLQDEQGRFLVDIRMSDLSASSLQALQNAGAQITHISERYSVVTALVAPSDLNNIAEVAPVQVVQEEFTPMHSSGLSLQPRASSNANKTDSTSACPSGVAISEGDTQLKAASSRSSYGVNGSGIKIGILSDSYARASSPLKTAAQDVASGDLPGSTNPCGFLTAVHVISESVSTSSVADEGRAMLQIVHDLAPGATLGFASAWNGEYEFADNIRALRAWGADIIVDDISYFDEPFYQEGPVSMAIADVVNDGAYYFTSAANSNYPLNGYNVGSYEADHYRATPCPTAKNYTFHGNCHDFRGGNNVSNTDSFTLSNNGIIDLIFQWSEPWFGITTDLDIFLLDPSNKVVAGSNYDSINVGEPFERLYYQNTSGSTKSYRLVINRYNGDGTPRMKYILTQNTYLLTSIQFGPTNSVDTFGPTIFGHSASLYPFSVAAARYNDSNNPEYFSSHGPATHYYGPVVGTTAAAAINPLTIQQPDFTATDGGCTTFFGSGSAGCYRFYGTSAAAPHAAAVAALMAQEANSVGVTLNKTRVKELLENHAQAMSGGSLDSTGAGLVNALASVQWVQLYSTLTDHISFPMIAR